MSAPKLRNRRRLTINAAGTSTIGSAASAAPGSANPAGQANTVAAGTPAAAGLGRPTKYRLSPPLPWMLKRASRTAAAASQRKAAAQPRRPSGSRPHAKTSVAGATPNETTSASESNSTPKSLVAPVARATRPSSPSRTIANPTNGAAVAYSPRVAKTMHAQPQNMFATVSRLGSRYAPRRKRRRGGASPRNIDSTLLTARSPPAPDAPPPSPRRGRSGPR